MKFSRRSITIGVLALLLCLGALPPATSRASDTPDTANGLVTVSRYLSCALGVAKAHDPLSETVAWTYCLTLLRETLNDGGTP